MIQNLALTATDRLLVLAPHPDDESVATGGLLQHALAVGTRVLVVFFTDGDNNPWAQRATELRWRIGPSDRARFAVRRRGEVRAALERLGVPLADARFLGFPDQGTTDLLLHGNELAQRAMAEVLEECRPTVVVAPSLLDLHPDHSALAVLTALALAMSREPIPVRRRVRFLIHNPQLRSRRHEGSLVLPLSKPQQARKRAAIGCHKTQLVLRGSWLLSFAASEERYYLAESPTGLVQHPVVGAHIEPGVVAFQLASRPRLRSFGARKLCLVGHANRPIHLVIDLPSKTGKATIRSPRSGHLIGEGEFFGSSGRGRLELPSDLIPPDVPIFAKIEHQFGFFDEAGWKEITIPSQSGAG